MNLEKYLERIGYKETITNDLDTLNKIIFAHSISIPFENLNPLLKLPVRIDKDSVQNKLIQNKRGGYCYEQNTLLFHVLTEIGYNVRPLAGRVVWKQPIDSINSLTHMFLLVNVDDVEYLVDVGFGGQSLTTPLEIVLDIEQETTHEPYRIIKYEDDYVLQTKIADEWNAMYRFNKSKQYFEDFEVGNWYTSTHPEFLFTNILSVAKPYKQGRYTLHNNTFKNYELNGTITSKTIQSVAELKQILQNVFTISLDGLEQLDDKLQQFIFI